MDGFNDLNLVNEHLGGRRNEKFEGLLESAQNGGGGGGGNARSPHQHSALRSMDIDCGNQVLTHF